MISVHSSESVGFADKVWRDSQEEDRRDQALP